MGPTHWCQIRKDCLAALYPHYVGSDCYDVEAFGILRSPRFISQQHTYGESLFIDVMFCRKDLMGMFALDFKHYSDIDLV